MTKNYTYTAKNPGDPLSAAEWNNLAQDVDAAVDAINNGGVGGGGSSIISATDATEVGSDDHKAAISIASGVTSVPTTTVLELTEKDNKGTNVSLVGDNNINIEPRTALGSGEGKNNPSNADRKGGNISLKPGDDIELCSHHRGLAKNTEVNVKTIDGEDHPVDLQINAANICLTTKGKADTRKKDQNGADITTQDIQNGVDQNALYDDPDVMNVRVVTGSGRGYLKVRAQAIDLRCEDHGGIALQPKGYDGDVTPHMNKIKFEHGGGDGLEFGTFNTEKSSLFTDEYRFKKSGVIKLSTRTPVNRVTDGTDAKYDANDSTTHQYYQKQSDDFYDVIAPGDPTCTWEDVVTYIAWAKANNQGPWASQS